METPVKVNLLRIETFRENAITRNPVAGKGDTTPEFPVSASDEKKKDMADKVNVDPDTADPSAAWKRLRKGQRIKTVEPQKWSSSLQDDMMRFVCISDTHSRVERKKNFYLPDGDVLLFAGDMTMGGSCEEISDFNRFIGQFPHKEKLVIAGNHDFLLEEGLSIFERENLARNGITKTTEILTNCTFIQDELVEVAGIKIFGSPWVPVHGSRAFSLLRGEELLNKWNNVPESTDILMTHAPPLGIGDTVPGDFHVGCVELLNTVQRRVKPKYHVFGHIHEGYGMYTDGTTHFVNASICATGYQPVQRPIVFDLKIPEGHYKTDFLKRGSFSPHARSDCTFDQKEEESYL